MDNIKSERTAFGLSDVTPLRGMTIIPVALIWFQDDSTEKCSCVNCGVDQTKRPAVLMKYPKWQHSSANEEMLQVKSFFAYNSVRTCVFCTCWGCQFKPNNSRPSVSPQTLYKKHWDYINTIRKQCQESCDAILLLLNYWYTCKLNWLYWFYIFTRLCSAQVYWRNKIKWNNTFTDFTHFANCLRSS